MRIGIISLMHDFPWGGSEALWSDMARAAQAEGHELFISGYQWDPLAPVMLELKINGARLHLRRRMPHFSLFDRIKIKLGIKQVDSFKEFFSQRLDLLIINDGGTFGFVKHLDLIKNLEKFSAPYFFISQFNFDWGVSLKENYQLAGKLFVGAKAIFFVSERNLHTAERELAMKLPNASIVRNPVNLISLDAVPYPSDNNGIQLASVARLDCDFKGQDILFETMGNPVWRNRNWTLNLYGQGPDEDYLKELAIFYKISDKIVFHNHVQDIRGVWLSNHILLMPSIGEGIPLSLVEAMLCARPCVTTDVGGNSEWIADGDNGFLAEAPLKKYFEAALERAWTRRNEWNNIGINARKTALQKVKPNAGKVLLEEILSRC